MPSGQCNMFRRQPWPNLLSLTYILLISTTLSRPSQRHPFRTTVEEQCRGVKGQSTIKWGLVEKDEDNSSDKKKKN